SGRTTTRSTIPPTPPSVSASGEPIPTRSLRRWALLGISGTNNTSTTSESSPRPRTRSPRKSPASGSGSATGSDSPLERRWDDDRRLLLFPFFLLPGSFIQPGAIQLRYALARRFRILTVRVAV